MAELRPPFETDVELTQKQNLAGRMGSFATEHSIRQAFSDNDMEGLADKKIAFPVNGVTRRGTVVELTREGCSIEDLSKNYPEGFVKRAGLFALIPAAEF